MKNRLLYLVLPISGVLTGICVSYFLPEAVEWASLVPFLMLVFSLAAKGTPPRGTLIGFLYFYPYYLTVWYWFLTMYPLDFTGMSRGAALAAILAAWLGLPLLQALFAMLQVPVFFLASRSRFAIKSLYPVIYGAIYVFFEWMQTLTWAGVPWGRLAIGQAYVPVFVNSASLFGSYFVSFVIVSVNGYLALAILSAEKREMRRTLVSLGLAAAIFAVNLTLGGAVMLTREADDAERAVTVGALQGNISSKDKWKDNSTESALDVYEKLTESAAADGAEMIVWTESALPYKLNTSLELLYALEDLSSECNVTLFATGFWSAYGEDGADRYNAVVNVSPETGVDRETVYRKQRLVPFGEFVPFKPLVEVVFPPLAGLSMFGNNVGEGDGAYVADTAHGKVGNLICFDSIYEEYSLAAVRDGAELITISTNDSWFGQSAALFQHTGQGILRAIETDRYIVRAANTGYTCVIAPSGELIDSMPIDTRGYVVSEVYMRSTVTLYSVIGNLFVWIAAAVMLFFALDGIRAGIINKRKKKVAFSLRPATEADTDALVKVYADGREAIASLGIDQWQDGYPSREVIENDIRLGATYVAVCGDVIASAAVLLPPPEPDYAVIDGEWRSDTENYAVIHRIASSADYRGRGASSFLLRELMGIAKADGRDSVRMDTHRGNTVMQGFLAHHGFEYCGLITLSHGDGDKARMAYELSLG